MIFDEPALVMTSIRPALASKTQRSKDLVALTSCIFDAGTFSSGFQASIITAVRPIRLSCIQRWVRLPIIIPQTGRYLERATIQLYDIEVFVGVGADLIGAISTPTAARTSAIGKTICSGASGSRPLQAGSRRIGTPSFCTRPGNCRL